ncbi:marine proteobacterial sortase target protein [Motiliproteus sp. MSK22-1]|uniref:marine proteobacterial sortase target protein n=1 Tax=Motiliproteus sp. MSK22-1 TaxID=1897630 RepID=UPI000975D96D|nr:marine proteobacterial sortase target protein [Motiliproteus sp. MSK22-1]OMH33917.1 marine proteobacterial sortase target protein [Motiliproteus sp. MSK22-1]
MSRLNKQSKALRYFICSTTAHITTYVASLGIALLSIHAVAQSQISDLGELMLQGQDNSIQSALLQQTRVHFSISGMLVRSSVSQSFRNDSNAWVEGIYSFPLPEKAAVDHLRMKVGERIIEGQIKERNQARKTYDKAKQRGQRASLIEQQRPNIFTTSVANIGPGETVEIEIEYQQLAHYDSGQFRLRFPMVVAPRYIPGKSPISIQADHNGLNGNDNPGETLPSATASSSIATILQDQNKVRVIESTTLGWSLPTDQVPDAHRITPPVAQPGEYIPHRVTISADIKAGFPLQAISSSYQPIKTVHLSTSEASIRLAQESVPADSDFELIWTPELGIGPQAALLSQQKEDPTGKKQHYGLLMVLPPSHETQQQVLPKSMTLVLDISGSMHGSSIEQAKLSILRAIAHLNDKDRFNLIVFNNQTRSLYPSPMTASKENRAKAIQFIHSLNANGGTEMAAAIRRALNQPDQPGYVEQVLFITDGSVGNEDALFKLIKNSLKQQRLFTVGIGSAPNSHFMNKAAQLGKGTFTYVGSTDEVKKKMDTLFNKLGTPQLTDIQINGPEMLVYPDRIPDLYLGEPLLISFRGTQFPKKLQLSGKQGAQTWQQTVVLKQSSETTHHMDQDNSAVSVLWARRRIASRMDDYRQLSPSEERENIRSEIIQTALEHHLVSKFTSLVAVDITPIRPDNADLNSQSIKTEFPKGWTQGKVFRMAKTATPAPLNMLIGTILLVLAALIKLGQYRPGRTPLVIFSAASSSASPYRSE